MIEVQEIEKRFGEVRALNGASFVADNGQITGLLGPNGAGKTTLLRILYTVLRQDTGTAVVDGFDTLEEPLEVQRRIGVLPDSHGLYPRLTAIENIRYFGQLHDVAPSELDARIAELVELLDMSDIADRRTEGFSTGQRVKVAIARALVQKPANVMLDEPTSGLDVPSTRAMRTFIRHLKKQGTCVVFSSHIMQEVAALCDRIIVMSEGRVAASGSPDSILEQTGCGTLEDAFVKIIGSEAGLT